MVPTRPAFSDIIDFRGEHFSHNGRNVKTERRFVFSLVLFVILSCALTTRALAEQNDFLLVESGKPRAVIISDIPEGSSAQIENGITKACNLLQMAVEISTGVKLDILTSTEARTTLNDRNPILIGGGDMSKAMGIPNTPLPEEGYRIFVSPKVCALMGNLEKPNKEAKYYGNIIPTAYYAVSELIQRNWNGRWLWPGKDGFSIPPQTTLSISSGDQTFQPKLELRWFSLSPFQRYEAKLKEKRTREGKSVASEPSAEVPDPAWEKVQEEVDDWMSFHKFGRRVAPTSHSFADWWEKYHETNPDYFALPIPGARQPYPTKARVKLRDGNPKVIDQIVAEWQEAGKPEKWGVGPNDGVGFCTAPESMAMDVPPNQDPTAVWSGDANLSARYSKVWQTVLDKMKVEKPDIRLGTIVYGCYRTPPPADARLKGLEGGFVNTWLPEAKESWEGWTNTGTRLYSRPNWVHIGAGAPYIQPHAMGDFVKWSIENGSIGNYFDAMLGFWGTQGITYYVLARLTEEPSLTVDQILEEYASAFGKAAPQIKEYIKYWEDYSTKCAYPIPAGGSFVVDPDGLYETAKKKHNLPNSVLSGSHRAMAYLYPDEIIQPAEAILVKAEEAAGDSAAVKKRIQFLRDGLKHLTLNRDAVILGLKSSEGSSPDTTADFRKKVDELKAFRAQVTSSHVVWSRVANTTEEKRNSPAAGVRNTGAEVDERGL